VLPAPPGELRISDEALEYGQVLLGASATKSFTVTNAGGTAVTITKSDPPSGGAFTATSSLLVGTSVAPGESVTETVAFSPSAAGAASGVWSITGSDTSGSHEVKLSGTGSSAPVVEQPLTPLTPGSSTPAIIGGVLSSQESHQQSSPDATLRGSTAMVGPAGKFSLEVSCAGDGVCVGKVVLQTLERVALPARRPGSKPARVILAVASGTFAVAGGRDAQVRLHLSVRVLQLLERAHTLRVSATVLAGAGGGAVSKPRSVITLRLAAAKRARSGRL
jgi:iron transport multicopper oxidase